MTRSGFPNPPSPPRGSLVAFPAFFCCLRPTQPAFGYLPFPTLQQPAGAMQVCRQDRQPFHPRDAWGGGGRLEYWPPRLDPEGPARHGRCRPSRRRDQRPGQARSDQAPAVRVAARLGQPGTERAVSCASKQILRTAFSRAPKRSHSECGGLVLFLSRR